MKIRVRFNNGNLITIETNSNNFNEWIKDNISPVGYRWLKCNNKIYNFDNIFLIEELEE